MGNLILRLGPALKFNPGPQGTSRRQAYGWQAWALQESCKSEISNLRFEMLGAAPGLRGAKRFTSSDL